MAQFSQLSKGFVVILLQRFVNARDARITQPIPIRGASGHNTVAVDYIKGADGFDVAIGASVSPGVFEHVVDARGDRTVLHGDVGVTTDEASVAGQVHTVSKIENLIDAVRGRVLATMGDIEYRFHRNLRLKAKADHNCLLWAIRADGEAKSIVARGVKSCQGFWVIKCIIS